MNTDSLKFSLVLNVQDAGIINSLMSLVCERMKRVSQLFNHARIVEVELSQQEESKILAKVTMAYNEQLMVETCTSRMWDIAFLNALDSVQERLRTEMAVYE